MKTKIGKISCFLLMQFIFFMLVSFASNCFIYAQEDEEGDALIKRYQWYYGQRKYPFDTIPSGVYGNAISQRNALRSSNGYQFSAPSTWQPKGPKPFDYGQTSSGRVNNIKYDPRDPSGNTIYITGCEGGVWKTVDGGDNWTDISGNLPTLSAGALTLDIRNGNLTLYFGSGDYTIYYGSDKGLGLFKSTDDGGTWTSINGSGNNILPARTVCYRIAIDPNNPSNIFLAEFTGLYRTTDGGQSWFKANPSITLPGVCTDVCYSPSGNIVYAIGNAPDYWVAPFNGIGYWKSTNGGSNFQQMDISCGFPHSTTTYGRSCLAVSQSSENTIYILSYDNYTDNLNPHVFACRMYVYKSTNAGDLFSSYTYGVGWNMGDNAGYNEVIKCSDVTPDICFMGLQDSYRTQDGGLTWYAKGGYYGGHGDVHAIEFKPGLGNQNKIAEGNDGGIFTSDNLGDNWNSKNQNLSFSMIYRVASNTYNPDIMVGGLQDFGFGYKNPAISPTHWTTVTGMSYADGTQMLASPFRSNHFIGSSNAFAYLSYSTNGTDFPYFSGLGYTTPIAPMAYNPGSPGVAYTLRNGGFNSGVNKFTPVFVLKSSDDGASWGTGSPFRTIDPNPFTYVEPTLIAVSPSNPNIMIMDMGNVSEFWHYTNGAVSRLLKSTDGGLTWEGIDYLNPIITGGLNGFPDRFFTHVEFDPTDENVFYLTLSGYGTGHVFRVNYSGGIYSWTDVSGSLPDNPVNDLIIRYSDCNTKELIVASDVGVFRTDASNILWKEVATGLPNTSVCDLDYNKLSGKLRASCFGRGIWEFSLTGPIYVKDNLFITDNVTLDHQIVVCNGGKVFLGNSAMNIAFTINFENNANILVMDGGELATGGSGAVTLTSSGSWPGIEFQNGGYGSLYNCTFNNTITPVTVHTTGLAGPGGGLPPRLNITYCTFLQGPITVNNRGNVFIDNCTWNYSSAPSSTVCGVNITGAPSTTVQWSNISIPASVNSITGISLIQSSGASMSHNTIRNTNQGIFASNCDANIRFSDIGITNTTSAQYGIALDNCANSQVNWNIVTSYGTGISLINYSSAIMHDNTVTNSGTYGLYCSNSSNPRMTPTVDNGNVYWDAGLNVLRTTTNGGTGLFITNFSTPNMAEGYNTTWGGNCYIDGNGSGKWSVTDNCWVDDPPVAGKFCVTGFSRFTYIPYSCTPPPGAGGQSGSDVENPEPLDPPQPMIVDYGNGVIDTLKAGTSSVQLSADLQLFNHAVTQSLQSNFPDAINTYKLVVQNYPDSTSAIESLKKIFYCYGRMHADTAAYADLRSYYLGLFTGNSTAFGKTASELSRKCLVKKAELENAVGEYENAVQQSTNHVDSVSAEVNIIEIYMLMQNQGGLGRFTGRLGYLKPLNVMDGMRMIKEKLYNIHDVGQINEIPQKFSLSQNYPNPFNPTTKIKFALPSAEKVTLKIYDILGRVVKTLVNGELKDAGSYEITFDATNLASGIYFYRIEAGKFVQSKKMVLLR